MIKPIRCLLKKWHNCKYVSPGQQAARQYRKASDKASNAVGQLISTQPHTVFVVSLFFYFFIKKISFGVLVNWGTPAFDCEWRVWDWRRPYCPCSVFFNYHTFHNWSSWQVRQNVPCKLEARSQKCQKYCGNNFENYFGRTIGKR